MKRNILLGVTLALAGVTLFLVSPANSALSKNNNPNENQRRSHPAFAIAPLAVGVDNDNESLIKRGFEIAPVPLDLKGKNHALVGLGSYIVNTGGCTDCHTNPPYAEGGDPFLGQPEQANVLCYLSGGQEFGPYTSRNLTPNSQGLPAGLTLDEFIHTMRTGEDLDTPGVPPFDNGLLQVMPWPVFGKKTTHELTAVYEYLRSIPRRTRCSPPPPPPPA